MSIFLCLTYFFNPIFMSGVSSELSSSTQLSTVTLYVKTVPFLPKQNKVIAKLGAFWQKIGLYQKENKAMQTNQAERTTQRKTSSKWAWTPRTSCRWRHRTSWRCFLSKQMFWTIVWNVRPKKLVKLTLSNLTWNKSKSWWITSSLSMLKKKNNLTQTVVLRIFDKPFGQLTKIRRCVN